LNSAMGHSAPVRKIAPTGSTREAVFENISRMFTTDVALLKNNATK